MKIQSAPPIAPVETPTTSSGGTSNQPAEADSPATRVSLSSESGFVDAMRDKASPAPFRQDVVDQVKAQLADGTFEASVDMDRVVDGLMAGL
jgi:flagellar biosynthesis anti-sigma factor FlgM